MVAPCVPTCCEPSLPPAAMSPKCRVLAPPLLTPTAAAPAAAPAAARPPWSPSRTAADWLTRTQRASAEEAHDASSPHA
eukprot:4155719-Prymnesium_polylepis.1